MITSPNVVVEVESATKATEGLRQFEARKHLVHWRSASANEIRLETRQDHPAGTLRDNSRTLDSCLRISLELRILPSSFPFKTAKLNS
ncbi:MAG: hypothetical protein ABF391_00385 [Akkermansiaceae bacterium]